MADFQKWHDEGNDALTAKDYEKALSCFQKALESNPEFTIALHSMGVAYQKLEQFDKALECFDKRLAIDKFDTGLLNQKGITLRKMNRYDDAIKVYDQIIEINDLDTAPWINKGAIYNEQEQDEKAIKCFDNALKINPNNKLAWTNKKITYSNQGMTEKAKECEEQENKLEDKPDNTEVGKDRYMEIDDRAFKFQFNRLNSLRKKLNTPDKIWSMAEYLHRKRVERGIDYCDKPFTIIYETTPAYLYIAYHNYDVKLKLDSLVSVSNIKKEKIIKDVELILKEWQQTKKFKIIVSANEAELFTDKKNIEIK